MIDIKTIRDVAAAAPQDSWRYEPTGQTVWAGNTYMVAAIRGWSHLRYLPNGAEIQDATGVHIAAANPTTVLAMCDEIERLSACLKKANDQAEHFEREWYLRGDEIERLRADAADWRRRYEYEKECGVVEQTIVGGRYPDGSAAW